MRKRTCKNCEYFEYWEDAAARSEAEKDYNRLMTKLCSGGNVSNDDLEDARTTAFMGNCRRYPPVFYSPEEEPTQPPLDSRDWCGEFTEIV